MASMRINTVISKTVFSAKELNNTWHMPGDPINDYPPVLWLMVSTIYLLQHEKICITVACVARL